jgi:sodium-coupled neutral amino acid transporter 11
VITVVVQGILTPREQRGSFDKSLLVINDGIFQAIGVISFGISPNMHPFPTKLMN